MSLKLLRPIVDPAALVAWSLAHDDDTCACCHKHPRTFVAHRHHLIKRSYRRLDIPCNLIKLCWLCHSAAHGGRLIVNDVKMPELTFANLLWTKKEANPDEWDRKMLAKHFTLPRLQKPAAYYFALREKSKC